MASDQRGQYKWQPVRENFSAHEWAEARMCIYSVGIETHTVSLCTVRLLKSGRILISFRLKLKFVRGNYLKDEECLSQMIKRAKTRYNVVTDLMGSIECSGWASISITPENVERVRSAIKSPIEKPRIRIKIYVISQTV